MGDFLYCMSAYEHLTILDVSDPETPEFVSNTRCVADPSAIGISFYPDGDYGYSICGTSSGGFLVPTLSKVDITDPEEPEVVGTISVPNMLPFAGIVNPLMHVDDYCFVIGAQANYHGKLSIVDVTGEAPTLAATILPEDIGLNANLIFYDIYYQGYLYVSCMNALTATAGFVILDISDPTSPVVVGEYESELGTALGMIVDGVYVYIHGVYYFEVVDISDIENPVTAGSVALPDIWSASSVKLGDYIYLGDRRWGVGGSWAGLKIIDVSTPSSPVLTTVYLADDIIKVSGQDGTLYVSYFYGFKVEAFDITDPTDPDSLGSISGGGSPNYCDAIYAMRTGPVGPWVPPVVTDTIINGVEMNDIAAVSGSENMGIKSYFMGTRCYRQKNHGR